MCKVTCPRDGEVIVSSFDMVLDAADSVYRFTCPACKRAVDKPLDDMIWKLLRAAGVGTIDEMCDAFAAQLSDDANVVRGFGLLDA